MPYEPGHALGRYEIRSLAATGGMGEVYRGFDPVLEREVAIKVIKSGEVAAGRLTRFQSEIRAIAGIAHANVLTIHDCGVGSEGPYLVTELLQGEPLSDRVASGPLDASAFLSIAVQILKGLEAA